MSRARVFRLHIHYLTEPNRKVWAISTSGRYLIATDVQVHVPLETVFRGPGAKQPKAYLKGRGVVRRHKGGVLSIKAA